MSDPFVWNQKIFFDLIKRKLDCYIFEATQINSSLTFLFEIEHWFNSNKNSGIFEKFFKFKTYSEKVRLFKNKNVKFWRKSIKWASVSEDLEFYLTLKKSGSFILLTLLISNDKNIIHVGEMTFHSSR